MISVVMDVLAKSFDFSGRATRKEFWVFTLAMAVVLVAIVGIEINAGIFAQEGPVGPFSCLFMLLLMFPSTAVMVRRFHDVGMSGWWCLMGVVPFLGHFMQFVFMVSEGTYGPNEYGEDPLSRGADVERFDR